MKKEKIVFMGTPKFAETALLALRSAGYEVGLVFTKVDSKQNRGKKVLPSPVKLAAENLGIEVLQPEKLTGNEEIYARLKEYQPDLIVVAAYGKILPKEILELPGYGCINIHASLLPKFRGAAPIQRVVMSGDKETGVTLMKMVEGLDTGDMIAKVSTPIANKNTDELFEELAILGADLLIKTLPKIFSGEAKYEKQDDTLASYAEMVRKEEGKINFSQSSDSIERQIRAIPSYTSYRGEMLKIWKSELYEQELSEEDGKLASGSIIVKTKNALVVKCGKGALSLLEVQMPGKKRIKISDFLNGNEVNLQEILS